MKKLAVLLLLALPLTAAPRKVIVELAEHSQLRHARLQHTFDRVFRGGAVEVESDAEVEALRRTPGVLAVWPDAEVQAHAVTAGLTVSHLPWERLATNATGAGIRVAVIDSGIDYRHPALGGGIGPGRKVVGGWDFVNDDADPVDDFRHGTHVAGIIAAQSAQMTGVAPGVSLLAYKVLDNRGSGLTSDVIAALDRAMDPNSDGDTSDRADIVNMSLGSPGHPDDPLSRAVERAVALGTVVVVSAGNEGEFHRVASPGVAESAITVGASNAERKMAEFSSRGPATGTGSIKPDLVAPGVKIRSTGLEGLFIELSGTSMAAPYVAGLAALLIEEHPEWSPARVKSALVNTAAGIAGEEMMTQGSGVVEPDRVFASELFVAPTQLNFGLDAVTSASWSTSRTLTFHNTSSSARTLHAIAEGTPSGVTLQVEDVTIPAGESRTVTVTVAADHAVLGKPLTRSLSFGGALVFTWQGSSVRVPWAFIRAGRATVTYAGGTPDVLWNVPEGRYGSSTPIGANGLETLVEPGTYELAVVAAEEGKDVRVIVAEEQKIEGDVKFAFSAADAPHTVTLEGLPARSSGPAKLYSIRARLASPPGSLVLPMETRTLRTSSFSSRYALLVTEAFVDTSTRQIEIAQHEPVRGLSGGVVLSIAPEAYASQELRIDVPAGTTGKRQIQIMPRDIPRGEDFGPAPASILAEMDDGEWIGTLTMTRESHENYASGVQIAVRSAFDSFGRPLLTTPVIRRNSDGFFAVRGFDPAALPVYATAGEPLVFGEEPLFVSNAFEVSGSTMMGLVEVRGPRGENRRVSVHYEVRDGMSGTTVSGGTVETGSTLVPLPWGGKLRVMMNLGRAVQTLHFDTSTTVATPPALTSLAVLDGTGRRATKLVREGNGSFVFSATDAAHAHAFFRRLGHNTWVELTPVAIGTDETAGTIYRIDLADALRVPEGEIEMAIEIADDAGTYTTWQGPVFTLETPSVRRRAVRK